MEHTSPKEKRSKRKKKIINAKKSVEVSKKSSHLYLQEKYLKKIPNLSSKDVIVLYLFNNCISKIENLDGLPNLTSLYLQNNQIERIENLDNSVHLKRLYIGHNKISVLEGLENLKELEELHIEKQNLLDSSAFCFDPRSVHCISETLSVLNISHNNVTSITYLSPLRNLKVFNASFNDLDDIKEVCDTVSNWYYVRELVFIGNPFTKQHHYKETIVSSTNRLEILDSKSISYITRSFIRKLEKEKLSSASHNKISVADISSYLPRSCPPSQQKAVLKTMLKESNLLEDLSTFDEKDAVYIPWKTWSKQEPFLKVRHLRRRVGHTCNTDKTVLNGPLCKSKM